MWGSKRLLEQKDATILALQDHIRALEQQVRDYRDLALPQTKYTVPLVTLEQDKVMSASETPIVLTEAEQKAYEAEIREREQLLSGTYDNFE